MPGGKRSASLLYAAVRTDLRCSRPASPAPAPDWVAVAVGIPVARYPPHRSVRALLSAYGSYLRWVAANRSVGQGCNTRGGGSQRVAHGTIRSQVQRRRWL